MNDFDANLIREFRSRPAFYDRNNPRFKDKVFTAREWQEISNKLGYDVSLLKDRMLQLRNRYNLEKRRIEQLREENPEIAVESPWPLFDHLHFLSEHIRARRSYKRMLNAIPQQATRMDLQSGGSNSSSGGEANVDENGVDDISRLNLHAAGVAAFQNGYLPVRVKLEQVDEIEPNSNGSEPTALNGDNGDGNMLNNIHMQAYQQHQQNLQQQQSHQQNETDADESEGQSVIDNGAFLAAQSAAMLSNKQYAFAAHQQRQQRHQQQQHQQQQRLHPPGPTPLKIRRIDSLRSGGGGGGSSAGGGGGVGAGSTNVWIPVSQHKHQKRHHSHHSNSSSVSTNTHSRFQPSVAASASLTQPIYATPREQKYAAFGDFVASSLLDLPPATAMHLIEKFTTEVVKVLIENDEVDQKEKKNSKVGNCNGIVSGNAAK